jgi:outer membrane protein TolC
VLGQPGVNSIYTTQQPGTGPFDPTQAFLFPSAISFPLVLNQWLLQANITVPISDYFLRLDQQYTSATHSRDALRYDAIAARAKSASDGKVAFYTWLRARGAVVVAVQTLNDQRTHLRDAENEFAAANASKADVLRAQTAVSSAELAVERAKNLADLTEVQVRIAMHAPEEQHLAPGESLLSAPAPFQGDLKQLTQEAMSARYEIKSIDSNAQAARLQVDVVNAGKYPVLSGFGDVIYGNPNPRRFPASQDGFTTWDVGAQIVWSPNDLLTASPLAADAQSKLSALEAQRMVTRDGIEVEVMQAWQQVKEADFAIESTKQELVSAIEASRVARQLFLAQRGTATTLTDAETDLTRARLDQLNALADARIARVRLDHALGRDVRPLATR